MTVAATQFSCDWNVDGNIAKAERAVREAAKQGAQIILLPELFETPYFCIEQDVRHLGLAQPAEENRAVQHFKPIARELGVVLPISFFERSGVRISTRWRSSMPMAAMLGVYRKSHIPNGPGYQEKNYFSPGDTGFKVWDTRFARIGVGICWDQWFPETARAMALMGAELLLLPDGDRHRAAARVACEFARPLAAHSAGSCGRESHAGDHIESLRTRALAPGSGGAVHQFLRLIVHRRCARARRWRKRGRAVMPMLTATFDLEAIVAAARQLVRVPRSAAGSLRAAAVARRSPS